MTQPIQIGKLSKPHGLRGEIHLIPAIDEYLDFIEVGKYILVRDLPYKITSIRQAGGLIIGLEGINDRTAVEGLKGLPVKLAYTEQLAAVKEEVPNEEWLGFYILDNNLQKKYGPIVDIIELPTQLTAVVEQDGKEILIPLHEDLILAIDPEQKVISMELPDGLIELYL